MQRTDRPVIDSSNYESQSIFRGAVVACPAIVCFIYYGVAKKSSCLRAVILWGIDRLFEDEFIN